MRIIKQGKLPEEKTYQAICRNCKTEFEFKEKEALRRGSWRTESYINVICPLCHKECSVDA